MAHTTIHPLNSSQSTRLKRRICALALAAVVAGCAGGATASTASAQAVDICWVWGSTIKVDQYMGCQYYRPFARAWVQVYPYGYGWPSCYIRYWTGSAWTSWNWHYNYQICNRRQN